MKSAIKILPVLLCFVSCTDIRHVQGIVAEADSLRTAGAVYDDSLRLDSAYQTLGSWWNRNIYPDDYARACYYYGKLLRNRGNQVEAMRCFIAGSYADSFYGLFPLPWFNDYVILGRIYSNIGTMCHEVEEFQLSCEMYEKSSEHFLAAGDSTMYYYSLNNIAFELAEQKEKSKSLGILNSIEEQCTDSGVLIKIWETKAELYKQIEQYDSSIICINELQGIGYLYSADYVIKAQSLWFAGQFDSALVIAKHVLQMPEALPQERYHMLYITSHCDSLLSKEEVNILNSDRNDIDNHILKPQKLQISAATELLRNSLLNQPRYVYFIIFLFSLLFIVFLLIYIRLRYLKVARVIENKRNQLASETEYERRLQLQLHQEQNDIIIQNKNLLNETANLQRQYLTHQQLIIDEITLKCERIQQLSKWKDELHWNIYDKMCSYIDNTFFNIIQKLQSVHPLNEKEIRLCVLVLIGNFSDKQMADILYYSDKTIRGFKRRVANKLGTNSANLRDFIIQKVIN